MSVCVCVRACVRVCVRACMHACLKIAYCISLKSTGAHFLNSQKHGNITVAPYIRETTPLIDLLHVRFHVCFSD